MQFFNTNGEIISQEEWIKKFEPYYFLGGPQHGRRINLKNQTSKFIESKIENILEHGLRSEDIVFVIAWKIGAIDHQASERNQVIIYKNNFEQTLVLPNSYNQNINVNDIKNYCIDNFNYLMNLEAEDLFNTLFQNRGVGNNFGFTYCISLVYFFTKRNWPIYDRFAHTAINAIYENISPGNNVSVKEINNFEKYNTNFVDRINNIFSKSNISRKIDRSLWVYGHFFKLVKLKNKHSNI